MAISTMKVSAAMKEGFSTQINCSHPFVIDQPKMLDISVMLTPKSVILTP